MPDNETVAVPVELLKRVVEPPAGNRQFQKDLSELRALLPKPRLVAVTREQWKGDYSNEWFDAQPDLLATLEDAMRPVMLDDRLGIAMTRICKALGVKS